MCYCSNNLPYESCCAVFVSKQQTPQTAEQLMRSRYSAYATNNAQYILETYARSEQQKHELEDIAAFGSYAEFINLEIIRTKSEVEFDYVEFKAHYLADGKHCQIHEISRFIKEQGEWKYLDGELFDVPEIKISRNDPCPCGSGKKFKKCHAN
jgi:SEC-C motif-containing protein|tara:strand:- start:475 stop:933 length:459 start_codon:yes stop_codon:yes gene_type:complete